MSQAQRVHPAEPAMVAFDGYPFAVTYIVPAFFHIMLLPADVDLRTLHDLVARQSAVNALPACLVLGERRCVYFTDGRGAVETADPPAATWWCARILTPAVPRIETDELLVRDRRLQLFLDRHQLPERAFIFGDPAKGGRDATATERLVLSGRTAAGWPRGLMPCAACGDPVGECLDPAPQFAGKLMTVHCRCNARNRCAGCGALFHPRKLNANYYDPADDTVWHVGGVVALGHRCGGAARIDRPSAAGPIAC